ncbi:NEAT domain-containing protein [Paenibacillus sp. WLX1005]|uniref:NEAT domain-containing protein n=1 Tax=Paenibacillus sp. WLX1005 TaxID=3243766 RepID=UPI0039844440
MTLKRRFAPYVIKCIVFVMLFSMISPALPSAFAEDTGSGDSSSVSADTYGDSSSGTVSNDTYSPAETPIYVPSQDPLSQFNYSTATTATYDTYADGQYTIGYKVVRTTDTSREVTAFRESYGNADRPGRVIVDNGKYTFSFRGVNASSFTDLTATQNNQTSTAVYTQETQAATSSSSAKNYTRVSFDVYDLNTQITLNYKFNDVDGSGYLILDTSTLTKEETTTPTPTPTDPELVEAVTGTKQSLTYTVFKDGTSETSMMDSYMQKPATLVTTADNKRYIQLGINSSSMVTELQTDVNGSYTNVGIIAKDTANDTRTVQFLADALTESNSKLSAKVHVVIPSMNYDNWYTVQFQFDNSSLIEETVSDINYTVLKDGTEEASIMDGYMQKPAQLVTKGDKQYIRLTVGSSSLIPSLQTKQDGAYTEVETVSQDSENNTRVVQFPISDVTQKVDAYTHVVIPSIGYDNWYYVQFKFDSVVQTPAYANGDYTLNYTVLHATKEQTSSMANYFTTPATFTAQDGKYYVSFDVKSSSVVTALKTTWNGALVDSEVVSENTANDTRTIRFQVANLDDILTAQVHVKATPTYEADYTIRFQFDASSLTPVTTTPTTGVIADGEYNVNFTVYKNGTSEASVMDAYTVKPAKLIAKSGKYNIQMTLNNSSWIPSFQTQVNGTLQEATTISISGDTRVVQFVLEDPTQQVEAYTHVVIPSLNYDNWYKVQLNFDTSDLLPDTTTPETPETPTPEDPTTEEPGNSEYADGTYTIPFSIYKDGTSDVSVMDAYVSKPATLVVASGKYNVRLRLSNSSWIPSFQTKVNGKFEEATIVSQDTNSRTVEFPIESVNTKTNVYTHVVIPDLDIGGQKYDHWYTVQIKFGENAKPVPASPKAIELSDGNYTADLHAWNIDEDTNSALDSYLDHTVNISVKDGVYTTSFKLNNSDEISRFQINESSVYDVQALDESTTNNQRTMSFSTKSLQTITEAYIELISSTEGLESVRLYMDPNSIQTVSTTPDGMADGKYSASLTAYKYGTKEISVMDEYLGKPATVLKKSGKYYVQVTLKNSSWIKTFKVGGQDAQVIETSGDTRVVQFPVTELPRKVKINTHVIVPGLEIGGVAYDHTYDVDLQIGSLMPYEAPKLSAATTTVPLDFTNLAAGKYKLPFSIVMPGIAAGTSSPLDRFMSSEEPVQLTVENGSRYVTMTLNNGNNIKALRVSNDGSYTDAEVVSSDETKNTKTVKFSVSDYTKNVPAQLVTTGGVSIASTTDSSDTVYDFAFKFDTASVTADSSTTDTANGKGTNNIANGDYTATYRILKNGSDADSVLTPYLDRTAKLTAKDGKVYATITIADDEAVPVFMTDYEGKYTAPEVVSQSQDGKSRTVTFEVPDLDSKLSIFAHANVSSRYMNNEKLGGQLLFDRATLKSNDGTTETQPAPTTEATPANPSGTTGTVPAEEATTGTNGSSDTGTTVTARKYSINVKVYKDKSSELSVMNDYVTPTATLVEENGVTYAELTLKNGSWMPVLQVEQDGALKDVEKVSSTGATTVVRFKVDNLSSKINAYTHVVVPGLVIGGVPYDHWYTVQFQFDEASKKELS